MSTELLPCPFCGGEPFIYGSGSNGNGIFREVVCKKCGMRSRRIKSGVEPNNKSPMQVWYKQHRTSSGEDYFGIDSSQYRRTVYSDDMKYADIKRCSTFFKTEEECQGYCDWLMVQESQN